MPRMKTLTVRLPESLAAAIEAESQARRISKSDIIRERLQRAATGPHNSNGPPSFVADLIGSVDRLPPDLSANTKRYLKATDYGRKRSR